MKFAKGSNLGACTVYGGTNVGSQRDKLREKNINVIVATPGRLLQFIRDDTISLRKLMFFVLDEADRMLDMGFQGMYVIFETIILHKYRNTLNAFLTNILLTQLATL